MFGAGFGLGTSSPKGSPRKLILHLALEGLYCEDYDKQNFLDGSAHPAHHGRCACTQHKPFLLERTSLGRFTASSPACEGSRSAPAIFSEITLVPGEVQVALALLLHTQGPLAFTVVLGCFSMDVSNLGLRGYCSAGSAAS